MLRSVLKPLYRRWGVRSLGTKVLLPRAMLILLSLIGSVFAFAGADRLARRRSLEQQLSFETESVIEALRQRADAVYRAGQALADDRVAVEALRVNTDANATVLQNRAWAVKDRFDLAVVQIYDQRGIAEAGIVPSSMGLDASAISSLLNMAEPGGPVARAVGDHLLLLGRASMLGEAGTVVVGVDLATELSRIREKDRISADLGLTLRGTRIGTDAGLPSDLRSGWVDDYYGQSRSIMIGSTPADLLVMRSTRNLKQVTHTTLLVVIGSTLLAGALLGSLNVVVMRSVGRSIRTIAAAAGAAAEGNLDQEVCLLPGSLTIGERDELSVLADVLNAMMHNLREHSTSLETKLRVRTVGLAIAADVARAVSSSLELDVILRESVQIIDAHLGGVCPGVYHVAIFLVERDSDMLVLREVAGEARDELTRSNIRIPVGSQSPVGLAIETRRSKAIQDVKVASKHLKPPLLMDTYSAAAIPLLSGEALIGALDVQSKEPAAFTSDALQLLNTLANQIATAVHNARLYQKQRQAAEHLAEVDQLKTHFLAIISHKLRGPLRTITGLSRAILEDDTGLLKDQQDEDLALIHSLGQHLVELVDDFLDLSEIKAGTITLTLEEVDMRLLIESALAAMAPLIEGRPVELCADIQSDVPVVRADKRRLRQIILNLLSNAAAFTRSSRISVHARTIEALNDERGCVEPLLEVCISDGGLGMSKEKLVEGFRAFDRLDNRGADAFASDCAAPGFGLSITKALVDLHGGRIWADSQPSEGTTFTFVLPVDGFDASKDRSSENVTVDTVRETGRDVL